MTMYDYMVSEAPDQIMCLRPLDELEPSVTRYARDEILIILGYSCWLSSVLVQSEGLL